jgi:hypothetical protein
MNNIAVSKSERRTMPTKSRSKSMAAALPALANITTLL